MKRIWKINAEEMRVKESTLPCCICGKDISFGYELAPSKIEALIISRADGLRCGECIARVIWELKFSLERR